MAQKYLEVTANKTASNSQSTTKPESGSRSETLHDKRNQTPHESSYLVVKPVPSEDDNVSKLDSQKSATSNQYHQPETGHSCNHDTGWKPTRKFPWTTPRVAEDQKHAWHSAALGMNSLKVADEWGFHSASASRSHSPANK
ncbi:hypothetical protein ACN47E_003626 [Coniothyrium glycines]